MNYEREDYSDNNWLKRENITLKTIINGTLKMIDGTLEPVLCFDKYKLLERNRL